MRKIFNLVVAALIAFVFGVMLAGFGYNFFAVSGVLFAVSLFATLAGGQKQSGYALNVIGTVAPGVGTTTAFNGIKGISGALVFEVSTTPQQITVNINGRITSVFLDTAGINNLCNPRTNGRPANSFYLPIANGLMTDFTMDITITNAVAAAFDLLAISTDGAPVDRPGFYVSQRLQINTGSTQIFGGPDDNFTYLALPSMTNSDVLTLIGPKKDSEGRPVGGSWNSRVEIQGLRALIAQRENAASGLVPAKQAIDNYQGDYYQVNFQPAANQVVYVQRMVDASFKGIDLGL